MQDSIDLDRDNKTFKSLFDNSPIAACITNAYGNLVFYNPAFVLMLGRRPNLDEMVQDFFPKLYHPDGLPMQFSDSPIAKALLEQQDAANVEMVLELADQTFKRVLVFSVPIFEDENLFKGTHHTFIDTTAKTSSEAKQSVLSAIVESSDDAIISKDLNGIILSWNQGAERIFGYTEKEMIGQPISVLIPNSRIKEEENIIFQIKNGNRVNHFETLRLSKTGQMIPISITVSPIKDSAGRIVGASKIARDISEQVEAQLAIKKNAENLEMLNSIGKVILEKLEVKEVLQKVTDATTRITGAAFGAFFYNTFDQEGEAFMLFTISGAPKHAFESLGMPRHTELFKPTFSGKEVIRIDNVATDPRYGKNQPLFGMPPGHLDVASYLAVPVVSPNGETIGGLLFGHPIPGIFKSEHEDLVGSIASQAAVALENSKLFAEIKALSDKKDEFIALASHELKTPLTTIKGYLQLLYKKEQDAVNSLFIGKTLDQVAKLNALIADLLDVSKIEAGKLQFNIEEFDLRKVLLDVMETFPYSYKTHKIVFNDPEEPCLVRADRLRIEQVIINLLTNAIKYSPNANLVEIFLEKRDGNVIVKIRDYGIGLKEQDKKLIFTRFYRAEGVVNVSGLGIGLHLTKEIIDRHHGKIGVDSTFGEGSEFYFSLPQ